MVFNLLEIWLFFKYCEIAAVWKLKKAGRGRRGGVEREGRTGAVVLQRYTRYFTGRGDGKSGWGGGGILVREDWSNFLQFEVLCQGKFAQRRSSRFKRRPQDPFDFVICG